MGRWWNSPDRRSPSARDKRRHVDRESIRETGWPQNRSADRGRRKTLKPSLRGAGQASTIHHARSGRWLADVGGDVVEGRVQVGADPLGRRDDGDRDKAGNQRVFDSGRAGFIAQELSCQLAHAVLHRAVTQESYANPITSKLTPASKRPAGES